MARTSASGRERETPRPPAMAPPVGLASVEVRGFRSARSVSFAPGAVSALVGEANAGKSNLIAAIRAALDPEAAPL
jgi:predicted ATP-dependent endonuclease of OLD family